MLDYDSGGFYDAGTVEVDDIGTGRTVDVAALPWVNGPSAGLINGFGNPAGGQEGLRRGQPRLPGQPVDLSSFAGQSVKPQFTMNTDNVDCFIGWYVDDIPVYTCDGRSSVVAGKVKIKGKAVVGKKLKASRGPGARRGHVHLPVAAQRQGDQGRQRQEVQAKAKDKGKRISVRVTGNKAGYTLGDGHLAQDKKVKRRRSTQPGSALECGRSGGGDWYPCRRAPSTGDATSPGSSPSCCPGWCVPGSRPTRATAARGGRAAWPEVDPVARVLVDVPLAHLDRHLRLRRARRRWPRTRGPGCGSRCGSPGRTSTASWSSGSRPATTAAR